MHDVSAETDYLQLVLHNDDDTPPDFVVTLVRSVFSRRLTEARAITATIETQGKAVCGTYPRAVAEALLHTARQRIRASGHSLLMTSRPATTSQAGFASCAATLQEKTKFALPARICRSATSAC
jgi:ATP-dependent Clp protease adapter protein ClpS